MLWFTLTPESAQLTCRTVEDLLRVVNRLKDIARLWWKSTDEEISAIALSKIDSANDYKGAFMPQNYRPALNQIQKLVSNTIKEVFTKRMTNFLSFDPLPDLNVY